MSRLLDNTVLLLVLLPVIGAVVIVCLRSWGPDVARRTLLVNTSLSAVLAVTMVARYDPQRTGPQERPVVAQMGVHLPWVPSGARVADKRRTTIEEGGPLELPSPMPDAPSAFVGPTVSGPTFLFAVDGLSLWFVALVPILVWCGVASAPLAERLPVAQAAIVLLSAAALTGVFAARDAVLWCTCLGLASVLLSALVGLWGGAERRTAARRLLLQQLAALALIVLGVGGLVVAQSLMLGMPHAPPGAPAFDLDALVYGIPRLAALNPVAGLVWQQLAPLFFLALTCGLLLWGGMVPFHIAAAAAIHEGSLIARVLLSLAATSVCGHGFLRIVLPLFPAQCASLGLILWAVALLGSLYVALVLRGETSAPRLAGGATALCVCIGLAGSLSLTAAGFLGSLLLCVSWPLSLTLWSIASDNVERYSFRSRTAADQPGERNEFRSTLRVPRLIALLSLIGVPGLAAFPGLLLILRGVFQAEQALPGVSFLPLTVLWGTVLITAWAFVRHATSHAEAPETPTVCPDDRRALASHRRPGRVAVIVLLVGLIVWLGLAPGVVVQRAEPTFATAARAAGLRGPL